MTLTGEAELTILFIESLFFIKSGVGRLKSPSPLWFAVPIATRTKVQVHDM